MYRNQQRVVVTGIGTINAVSKSAAEFTAALKAGTCGIGGLTVFDPEGHMTRVAAEVKDFNPRDFIPRHISLKRTSRADQFGLIAASEALKDAGLVPLPEKSADHMGVAVGGGAGGLLEAEAFYWDYLTRPPDAARFSRLASLYSAATADLLSSVYKLYGPKTTFMTACSSGATAIGFARDLIASGRTPMMLAGGTEPICRTTYTCFNALRAVDPEFCKPFDKNRRGLTLGEGSGFLVLESLEHARTRGARIHAEILGYALTADAHHMTAPDPEAEGAARAMRLALEDADLHPDQVNYINAHGTGTPANDVAETKAIKTALGAAAANIPVSSIKSMIGHTLGAAGALEAVACIVAISNKFVPPTVNHKVPDPECDLDYVVEGARDMELDVVLSNSFAFGGNNTTLVFGRFEEEV